MSEGSGGANNAPNSTNGNSNQSSNSTGVPGAEVDDSPLQKTMDKNKECKYTRICFNFEPPNHVCYVTSLSL